MKKKCPKCEIEKSCENFNKNKSRKDGLQNYCRECQKEIDKAFQPKRDLTLKKKNLYDIRKRNRQHVINFLKKNPCVDCGEADVFVLEFDHKKNKHLNVSNMVSRGYSLEKIMKEIGKCDVRCANCHRRKTAKQFGWYKDIEI